MRATVILALAAAVALAASSAPALAANDVPQFDVKPSCNAATQAANGLNQAGDNLRPGDRNSASCVNDEMNAKAKLGDEWTQYTVSQRQRCTSLATLGGLPSYVELLTCLELAKEAANIPAHQPAAKMRPGQ
jgi:hypothetical protein